MGQNDCKTCILYPNPNGTKVGIAWIFFLTKVGNVFCFDDLYMDLVSSGLTTYSLFRAYGQIGLIGTELHKRYTQTTNTV
jgi:hypothetical protein